MKTVKQLLSANQKRFILFLIFISNLSPFATSQNPINQFYIDSIQKKLKENYAETKNYFLKNKNNLNPNCYITFLSTSLDKKDISSYKIIFKKFVRDFGYTLDVIDTLYPNNFIYNVKHKNLLKWSMDISKKYHLLWLKNHYVENQINIELIKLSQTDQNIRNLKILRCQPDSNCFLKAWDLDDFSNIKKIKELCKITNRFPNPYDFGIDAQKAELIIVHNLKNRDTYKQTWTALGSYIEAAYRDGKLNSTLFLIYDQSLIMFENTQYYGTAKNHPSINDPDISKRAKDYKL